MRSLTSSPPRRLRHGAQTHPHRAPPNVWTGTLASAANLHSASIMTHTPPLGLWTTTSARKNAWTPRSLNHTHVDEAAVAAHGTRKSSDTVAAQLGESRPRGAQSNASPPPPPRASRRHSSTLTVVATRPTPKQLASRSTDGPWIAAPGTRLARPTRTPAQGRKTNGGYRHMAAAQQDYHAARRTVAPVGPPARTRASPSWCTKLSTATSAAQAAPRAANPV